MSRLENRAIRTAWAGIGKEVLINLGFEPGNIRADVRDWMIEVASVVEEEVAIGSISAGITAEAIH